MGSRTSRSFPPDSRERAVLVGLTSGSFRRGTSLAGSPGAPGLKGLRQLRAEQSLDELAGLAAAAGARVVLRVLQDRPRPDPATFLGSGKIEALALASDEAGADAVIFDNELTPAQLRNLETRLGRKVVDRTQLILDIFAKRARTREGQLQVELAQLRYLLPRLVGAGAALSRLGGGIGTRGPGETKLETDRRKIRQRIGSLSREIEIVRRRRTQLRERRHKASVPTMALVGYTNAGKTTLFNLLTGQHADVSNALFVTLDPLVRQLKLADRRELLVSDTVGFIDRLPHTLVAAFRATLEQVAEADLLLHVIDAGSPDRERRIAAVQAVLAEVGADHVPIVDVYNKCDAVDAAELERLRRAHPEALFISALRGTGREALVAVAERRLALDTHAVALSFDAASHEHQRQIDMLYRVARVRRHVLENGRVLIEADVPRRVLERFDAARVRRRPARLAAAGGSRARSQPL